MAAPPRCAAIFRHSGGYNPHDYGSHRTQKARGVNLVVLRKFKNKWCMVAHESAVPAPAFTIQRLDTEVH